MYPCLSLTATGLILHVCGFVTFLQGLVLGCPRNAVFDRFGKKISISRVQQSSVTTADCYGMLLTNSVLWRVLVRSLLVKSRWLILLITTPDFIRIHVGACIQTYISGSIYYSRFNFTKSTAMCTCRLRSCYGHQNSGSAPTALGRIHDFTLHRRQDTISSLHCSNSLR
jgi:hypothetical protein